MLIALTGAQRSGKSTVASILERKFKFKRHFFAKPLKEMLKNLGVNEQQLYGYLKNEPIPYLGGLSSRQLMQSLGTDWGRDLVSKDMWVNVWNQTYPKESNVVCEDLRFPNEYKIIKEKKGHVIEIRNNRVSNHNSHISERYKFKADEILYNNSSIKDLEKSVEELLYLFNYSNILFTIKHILFH